MLYPISEKIDQSMLAAVRGLRIANGFQIDLPEVQLWDPGLDPSQWPTPKDLLTYVSVGEETPAKDNDTPLDDTPINHQQWYRPYAVSTYLLRLPTDIPAMPTWRNVVKAEIEKAVLIDRYRGQSTYTIGSPPQTITRENANDTYCRGMSLFQDPNDLGGITVHFLVKYRHAENDPYLPD